MKGDEERERERESDKSREGERHESDSSVNKKYRRGGRDDDQNQIPAVRIPDHQDPSD